MPHGEPGPEPERGSAPGPGSGPTAAGSEADDSAGRQVRLVDLAAEHFRRWRAGDELAAQQLVELLTPVLWQSARAYRLDSTTAEDVVQSAWLALARWRDSLREPQAVLGWLAVTVRRDAAREARARSRFSDDPEEMLGLPGDPAADPASLVTVHERDAALWTAVRQLSERCRRLLRIIAFAERPDYAALSAELAMPIGSIGPTRGRCLRKLRELLGDDTGWRAT